MSKGINRSRRRFLRASAITLAATSWELSAWPLDLLFGSGLSALRDATAWLNSAPLAKAALQGKVVLVDFWTYSCINWRRSLPYIRAWDKRYRDHGLVVIGVHAPEFSFEREVENVRQAAASMGIDYPIAIDNEYAIWRAFDNQFWPALYLIDGKGRTRYHKFGEGDYEQSEAFIQRLLTEVGARGFGDGLTGISATGAEVAADWGDLKSGENYLGYERTENFASSGGLVPNKSHAYVLPSALKLNHWAIDGDWLAEKQAIWSISPGGRIAYNFHARDLHIVMGPETQGTAIPFRVLLDGGMPAFAHGTDISERGEGILREPRMYHLIRQAQPILDRKLEIEFLSPGAIGYSFTFG